MHLCRSTLLTTVATLITVATLSGQETYEEFKKQQQQGKVADREAYAQYKADVTAQYERFVQEHNKAFEEYKRKIAASWGKSNSATSTRTRWVGYDEDLSARRTVDFEGGQARVEVLLDPREVKDPDAVKSRLGEEISRLLTEKETTDPMELREQTPDLPAPILTGQVETRAGKPVSATNAPEFVEELLDRAPPQQKEVVGEDGKRRVAVSVQFSLIPNHVRVRADQFKELILRRSKEQNIPAPLVFAVVHTESYYNPRARSSAPAFGLMQLVPSSGARAAHMFLFGKDEVVSADYLYEPANNVQLGSGYLRLLMSREFKDVRDDRSRMFCAIAAYNTGPANVAKTFTGKRNVPEAVKVINGMTGDQVFSRMRAQLPYEETRAYIRNVTDRVSMYSEWQNND